MLDKATVVSALDVGVLLILVLTAIDVDKMNSCFAFVTLSQHHLWDVALIPPMTKDKILLARRRARIDERGDVVTGEEGCLMLGNNPLT